MKSFYKLQLIILLIFLCGCSSKAFTSNNSLMNPTIYNTPANTPSPSPIAGTSNSPIATPSVSPTPSSTSVFTKPSPTSSPSVSINGSHQSININLVGDIIFDSHVANLIDSMGIHAFISDIVPILSSSDLSIANLETPLSLRGEKEKDKQFNFRANPDYIKILASSGIDIVSLANNHILDYGLDAFNDTVDLLTSNNIGFAGAGNDIESASKPYYIEKNGMRIAFIASSRVIPFISWTAGAKKPGVASTYDPTRVINEIKLARKNSDFVIAYIHWGEEGNPLPLDYQRAHAKAFIDNGADLVIGSHPHVLQGVEFYKSKPICYSLGNFIFTDSEKLTAVLNVNFDANKKTILKIIPMEIKDFQTLYIKDAKKAQKLYRDIENISFEVQISDEGIVTSKN